jgi:hypothetical protein
MGKLHGLLAVESELKAEAMRQANRVKGVFKSGEKQLFGATKTYQPLEEDGEDFADEVMPLATTVDKELTIFAEAYGKWLDAALQKECTNRDTAGTVSVLSGVLNQVPAPALLNLESKLAEIRQVYAAIPANDPAERWTWDEQNENWLSAERITYKTKKVPRAMVAYEATPEHPAQVETYHEDVRVGTWTSVVRSGMLSPRTKRERLERLDNLIREVKKARQRANDIEAATQNFAHAIFDYINNGE